MSMDRIKVHGIIEYLKLHEISFNFEDVVEEDVDGINGILSQYGFFRALTKDEAVEVRNALLEMAIEEEFREVERLAMNDDECLCFIPESVKGRRKRSWDLLP